MAFSNPGRRSAATAATLCPGLVCYGPFGAGKSATSKLTLRVTVQIIKAYHHPACRLDAMHWYAPELLLIFAGYIFAICAVSQLCYTIVEKPFQTWIRRVGGVRRKA